MTYQTKDRRHEGITIQEQCRLVQLYLLDVFSELCERHHLRYFLTGGTLIGAMRHDGFIPWDDDVDIAMPSEDYRKFVKIADRELPDTMLLQTPGRYAGGLEGHAKLRDRCSFFCESNTHVQGPCGIYIDIFPYIKFPVLPHALSLWITKWCYLSWLSAGLNMSLPHRTVFGMLLAATKAMVWKFMYYCLAGVCHGLAFVLPTVRHDPLATPHVSLGPAEIGEDVIFPLSLHLFEGKMYPVPKDPDAVLRQHYGDWRTLPPPEKRQWHASIICPTQAPDAPWAMPYGGAR